MPRQLSAAAARAPVRGAGRRPIITLLTDFGCRDPFVGTMKGVILSLAPEAAIVDLSHDVPPQNVLAGSYFLRAAFSYFPSHAIHVAVVDPGVGTRRRPLVVVTRKGVFVGPDNGLLVPATAAAGSAVAFWARRRELWLDEVSTTFHGRDVFAPIAARLATGFPPERCGPRVPRPVKLKEPAVVRIPTGLKGEVVWVDSFGNLITNLREADILDLLAAPTRAPRRGFPGRRLSVTIGSFVIDRLSTTYGRGVRGQLVALVNSSGLLEVAARRSAASEKIGAGPGAAVVVRALDS